jgi:hypothetical protein
VAYVGTEPATARPLSVRWHPNHSTIACSKYGEIMTLNKNIMKWRIYNSLSDTPLYNSGFLFCRWRRPPSTVNPSTFVLRKFYPSFCFFNSHLFSSSSSMPRPLAYRHSLPLSNRYCMVVLKTCNEFMFFISVIPSEIRRFKFTVSWPCDAHSAAENLRCKRFSTSRYDSPLRAVEGLLLSKIDVLLIASGELVGDSRMGTAIAPRSR